MCHEPLNRQISLLHIITPQCLCLRCLNQFERLNYQGRFHGYKLRILYRYNEFFRTLLYQYKALYDIALKDTFLWTDTQWLKWHYRHFIVAVVPSDEVTNEKRGFVPNATIAKTFSRHVFTGLYKQAPYKQSQMDYYNRNGVYDIMAIRHQSQLDNQRVLLFDDVMTSGHTLLSCLHLLEQCHPRSIEILVLSTGQKRLIPS